MERWKCTLSEDELPPIHILDNQDVPRKIEYKHPFEAAKAVGLWKDLNGSSTKQMSELIRKVSNIHSEISKCPLPRHLNWIGLLQAIWKSIEYVLPVTTISRNEAAQLAKDLSPNGRYTKGTTVP